MDEVSREVLKAGVEVVAGKVYDDLIHPTFKAIGDRLAHAMRNIPIMQYNMDETIKQIEPKMRNISPDLIISPESYVAVPALQGISYCMDSEDLRKLYANLLAKSMNTETKDSVHPAYVEVIKQLSPDEAKMLEIFFTNYGGLENPLVYETYDIFYKTADKKGFGSMQYCLEFKRGLTKKNINFSSVNKIFSYIENLERLKLIDIADESPLSEKELEKFLISKDKFKIASKFIKTHEGINFNDTEVSTAYYKGIHFTEFGLTFCKVCLGS